MSFTTFIITFLAGFYIVAETGHFGWNIIPKTDAEWIADGMGLLLLSVSLVSLKIDSRKESSCPK